jgi:hypothetical protein
LNAAARIPAAATDLLEGFLSDACSGATGESLHAWQAPEAPLYRRASWRRRDSETAAAFATVHRHQHERGGAALPRFVAPRPRSWRTDPEGSAVLWFDATEARSGRSVIGALGVREERDDGRARAAWATLAAREEAWTFLDGRVRTLANFSWMELREPAAARTTLDAAWFRLHWLPGENLQALPGIRFACHASTSCCRQDYIVPAAAAAQGLIDALPWDRIAPRLHGTLLPVLDAERVVIKARTEACRFLGTRNECLIHAELGYQPFAACATFPFSFARTPEGVAVTASRSCGSVCEASGPPLTEREVDLRQRLAITRPRSTDEFRVAPGRAVGWTAFRDTEALLRALLERRELPLHRRLFLGARALGVLLAGGEFDPGAALAAPPVVIDAPLREQLGQLLDRIQGWDRLALRELPSRVPRDLRHGDLIDAEPLAAELENLHFGKVYSYEFDLTTAHNFAILLYLTALAWQRGFPQGLDALRRRELALLGSHGLLKSLLPQDAPPALRTLLGSAQFGEWALAFAGE